MMCAKFLYRFPLWWRGPTYGSNKVTVLKLPAIIGLKIRAMGNHSQCARKSEDA